MSTQIHDLGYRAYEGERLGVAWAVRSLALHSIRRALGLKRAGKHKIVPILTISLAFLPAIVMVGLSAFLPGFGVSDLLTYGDYYGVIFWSLFLFTAAAAPGVLTTDRTSGMLAMYLASPLTRTTYVLAKAIGLLSVMMLVTVAPIVFLVLAYTFVGEGPGGIVDFIELMARALLAGAIAAGFYTGLGMFVSSIPKRWGIASVSIIGALIVPSIVTGILVEGAELSSWISLASPADIIGKAWQHIFGEGSSSSGPEGNTLGIDELNGTIVVLTAVAYALLGLILTWWRYQKVEVDR